MPLLDLRNVGELFIAVLADRPFNFQLNEGLNSPILTGCSPSMVIKREGEEQPYNVTASFIVVGTKSLKISIGPLAPGVYNYILEIIPVSGDTIRFIDKIQATNG